MQTDPPVCVLPDDAQKRLEGLQSDIGQMRKDINSLSKMLAEVSAAQEQRNTLARESQNNVSQIGDEISSLKQTLEEVYKAQKKGIPLSLSQIMLLISVAAFLALCQTFTLIKLDGLSKKVAKLDKSVDDINKLSWLIRIRNILGILIGIASITTFVASLKDISPPGDRQQDVQLPPQELNLEAAPSPAEGPL